MIWWLEFRRVLFRSRAVVHRAILVEVGHQCGHLDGVAALVLNLHVDGAVDHGEATPVHEPPGLMAHDYQQSLSVALWDGSGRLISRTGDAPEPSFDTEQGFATLRLGPERRAWPSFTQWRRDHARKVSVMIELQERDELADDIAGQMVDRKSVV